MNEETKQNIDSMSYQSMLSLWRFSLWRFSSSGHPYFQSEIGTYFSKVMSEKQKQLPEGEHIRISKAIGW